MEILPVLVQQCYQTLYEIFCVVFIPIMVIILALWFGNWDTEVTSQTQGHLMGKKWGIMSKPLKPKVWIIQVPGREPREASMLTKFPMKQLFQAGPRNLNSQLLFYFLACPPCSTSGSVLIG